MNEEAREKAGEEEDTFMKRHDRLQEWVNLLVHKHDAIRAASLEKHTLDEKLCQTGVVPPGGGMVAMNAPGARPVYQAGEKVRLLREDFYTVGPPCWPPCHALLAASHQ